MKYARHALTVSRGLVAASEGIFVANRGPCAWKFAHDYKTYGHKDTFVAYTSPDKNLPLVQEKLKAGRAIEVESYDNPAHIIAAAQRARKEHKIQVMNIATGWGFLSENSDFHAQVVQEEGLNVFGAHAEFHRRAGDKAMARRMAQEVEPSFNPSFTQLSAYDPDLLKKYASEVAAIPDVSAYLHSPEMVTAILHGNALDPQRRMKQELAVAFNRFADNGDVAIKPPNLGGGRGISFHTPKRGDIDSYKSFLLQVAEAQSLDPSAVMIERRIQNAKHIEIQTATDTNGEVVVFGGRDCSFQRAGQKIIQLNVTQAMLEQGIIDAKQYKKAIEFAKNYCKKVSKNGQYPGNVATVEFMYADGRFYFLEANTRVQVEHTTTEDELSTKGFDGISFPVVQAWLSQGVSLAQVLDHFGVSDPALLEAPAHESVVQIRACAFDTSKQFSSQHPELFAPSAGPTNEFAVSDITNSKKVNINVGGVPVNAHHHVTYDPQVAWVSGRTEDALQVYKQLPTVTGMTLDVPWVMDHVVPLIGNPSVTTDTVDTIRAQQLAQTKGRVVKFANPALRKSHSGIEQKNFKDKNPKTGGLGR